MKNTIKQLIPPLLIRILKRGSKFGWKGNYKNWKAAMENCSGYNAANILEVVRQSTLKVKNGEAVYERDSVLFDKPEYNWPLIASLMFISALRKGNLYVIDFGGSLGSTYFQNQIFLKELAEVRWGVIEQSNFVKVGNQQISDEKLAFFESAADYIAAGLKPDVLLISCTLPYLEEPYKVLEYLLSLQIPFLIIDNTPFNYQDHDRITIQRVSPQIYPASYPCWFLSYNKLLEIIKQRYSIISEHLNDSIIDLDGHPIQYQGFLAQLNTH